MFKKAVSIFFTILFLGIISAPTIIVSIDDSVDISVLYSLSEEEENNSFKIEVPLSNEDSSAYCILLKNQKLVYHFKKYSKPYINLIFPPPENSIIS